MGYVESLPNSGQYFFADSIASWEWKEIRRRKLTRFDGHELVKRKGGYFLRAYTKKDLFSHDMFYKCSRLQTVILPKGMRIDYTVKDKTSQTKYMEYDGY